MLDFEALRRDMDQGEVMELARQASLAERASAVPWLTRVLLGIGDVDSDVVRAAQFATAWLPDTAALLASALRTPGDDRAFAIVCALTDASNTDVATIETALAPEVLDAVSRSDQESGEVAYIAAALLARCSQKGIQRLLDERGKTDLSDFFLGELRRAGGWPE